MASGWASKVKMAAAPMTALRDMFLDPAASPTSDGRERALCQRKRAAMVKSGRPSGSLRDPFAFFLRGAVLTEIASPKRNRRRKVRLAPWGIERAMKNLFAAAKLLLLDLASTFLFLVVFLLTKNLPLSVILGMALGFAQIGWQFARKKPIDTMQWMSLFLVLGFGTATLITDDPRFVMVKPSLIYVIVGVVMLKPGWMNRYLPPAALAVVADIAFIFGYVWAGLMFFSAALNVVVALNFSVVAWSAFMSVYAIVSKAALFLIQYGIMRTVGARRRRAGLVAGPA
jgi:intracellular septation protein